MRRAFTALILMVALCGASVAAAQPAPTATATASAAAPAASPPPAAPARQSLLGMRSSSSEPADWGGRVRSGFGLLLMLAVAFALSKNRRAVSWRLVGVGVGLQIVLGLATLSPPGQWLFGGFNQLVSNLLAYTAQGSTFLFGDLAVQNNMPVGTSVIPVPPDGANPAWLGGATMAPLAVPAGAWQFVRVGAFFAFGVLPTIIFFSSVMAVLYHLGVMQAVVRAIAVVMQKTMRTSGAETLSAAGNIFVGQTEAPLLIRPFVKDMTESELMAVMTGGFATVAGGVMVAYVGMLRGVFPEIAGHLLCASIMSAPAALVVAKIVIPEPDPNKSKTYGSLKVDLRSTDANVIDAAARGASEGLQLALNVGAMLLAFLAIIAMINGFVGWVGGLFGAEGLTMELMLGYVLRPFAWAMGVNWADANLVGSLLGIKTIANEFVAYQVLADRASELTSVRSMVIATYALCGFANFGSIGIQLGGISPLAPERRGDLARIGLRAMVAGTLAAFMTACVIGMMF
ncbi:MAG: NupC/NupG family nucleoside CNT transporter [Myxococcales bacterium]|nr:NupC/NupG family nucleoside CNT transporter [Myxococcales bacterium]